MAGLVTVAAVALIAVLAVRTGQPLGGGAPSATPPSPPEAIAGKGWIAEVRSGVWMAGALGDGTVTLPAGELGLAANEGWVLSAVLTESGETLIVRRIGEAGERQVPLPFVPVTIAISGGQAYVSGFTRSAVDSGVLVIDLATGAARELIPPTTASVPRTVAVSRTGATLVSALCQTEGACELDVVSLADMADRHVVPSPGYLRTTSDRVAVVGPDPAAWIAGVDLRTGAELWRWTSDEIWSGYAASDGFLVQASLVRSAEGTPEFAVDRIDLRTGKATRALLLPASEPVGLWSELSADTLAVVGPGFSVADALSGSEGRVVYADVFDLTTGRRVTDQLAVGG
jgi:hypothetical protein